MTRNPKHLLFGLEENQYSLKGLSMLCWLYVGTLLFAAIVSPLVFSLVHTSEGLRGFLSADLLAYLEEKPITRYFDRARILAVLVVLPLLFRYAKLNSAHAIGFQRPFSEFPKWFLYGLGMMIIVLAAVVFAQATEPVADWSVSAQIKKSLIAVFSASLLSVVEEVIFRGLVFRLFYAFLKPLPAILLSSLFFASLHFKMDADLLAHLTPEQVNVGIGFQVALGYVTAVTDGFNFVSFINYSLVGVLLHQAFLWSGNLWSSIGLHAGWVTVLLSMNKTFQATEQATLFTGSNRVIDGYWVTIVMIIFVSIFAYRLRQRTNA